MSSDEDGMPNKKDDEDAEEGEAGEDDECPPMPDEEKELLFLIEFLIDTMLVKPEHLNIQAMDPCLLQGQTCVVLTFLNYPPMCICESDVDPCRQTGGNCIKYNSGKSLMFALSEAQFENPPPIFLEVGAYRMLPHGTIPNKLPIGMTKIGLTELFKQVFKKVDAKPDKLPLSKSIKDNYQLMGTRKNCPTAEITIYIRLSCLGQNVVTEFQRGVDDCEPLLFRSKDARKVYECKPKELAGLDDPDELCPPLPGWGASAGKDCGDASPAATQPCAGESYKTDQPDDDEAFEEFGTEVHGHALTIKIQKSQKRGATDEDDPKMDQITFQVPKSQSLCKKGNNGNAAALYNVNSVDGGKCGSEPFRIVQGEDSPDKDVFFLRIGKKGETNGKGKLELELRTPKVKIERPVEGPRKYDKAVQTEKEEQPKKGKKKK